MRHYALLAVAACLLFVFVSARYENGKINIAVLTLDPESWPGGESNYTGPLKSDSLGLIYSYRYWEHLINERGGILVGSTLMPVNLTIVQTGITAATQKAAAQAAILSGDFDFFFGPFSSVWSINVAQVMEQYNTTIFLGHAAATSVFQCEDKPASRPPCTVANTRRFRHAFGVTPVGEQFLSAPTNLVALRGAKTMAGWFQDEDFTRGVTTGTFSFGRASGISVLEDAILMPLNATQAQYDALALHMKDLNPDVIVSGSRVASCTMFLAGLKRANFLPKALFTNLCATDPGLQANLAAVGLNMSDARYIIDSAVWDPRLRGPEFEDPSNAFFPSNSSGSSASLFWAGYSHFTGGRFLDYTSTSLAMAMGYALNEAIVKTQSIDMDTVAAAFPTILSNSFYGKIAFNGFGQDDAKSLANMQYGVNHTLEIVSPLSASTASMIYPMPTWDERIWVKKPFDYAGEKAIAVITALAVLFSLAMGILTFIYRDRKAIIASSPFFLYIMLTGSVLLYAGIFTWTLTSTSEHCMTHWWLLGLGFILMFGGLLVKVWRISRIFNDKDLSVIRISNSELLIVVGIAIGIELVLLILWTAISPSKALVLPTDPLRPSLNYMTCSFGKTSTVILAIMAAYKGAIIIAGVWLSISTWKIKYSIYNESRSIAFSMYNLFFFLVLAIIVQLVIDDPSQRKAQFIVRSCLILLGTIIPIAVIFLPKFTRTVHLNTDNIGVNSSSSKQRSAGGTTNSDGGESKRPGDVEMGETENKIVQRLKQQNQRLKEEVKSLRSQVAKLKGEK